MVLSLPAADVGLRSRQDVMRFRSDCLTHRHCDSVDEASLVRSRPGDSHGEFEEMVPVEDGWLSLRLVAANVVHHL